MWPVSRYDGPECVCWAWWELEAAAGLPELGGLALLARAVVCSNRVARNESPQIHCRDSCGFHSNKARQKLREVCDNRRTAPASGIARCCRSALRAAFGRLFAFGCLRCAPIRSARLLAAAAAPLRAAFGRLSRSARFWIRHPAFGPRAFSDARPRHCQPHAI